MWRGQRLLAHATLVDVSARAVVNGKFEAIVAETVVAAGQVETVVLAGGQLQRTLVHIAAVEVILQVIAGEARTGEGSRLVQTFLERRVK